MSILASVREEATLEAKREGQMEAVQEIVIVVR